MEIDTAFLREVQRRGWSIEAVTKDACIGSCPTPGCGVRAKLRQGSTIPPRLVDNIETDYRIGSMIEGAAVLRERRAKLRLTVAEVEHVAGVTSAHFAKAEMENPRRQIGVDTFVTWANTLGFDVVLRPAELPPVTIRAIAESRDKEEGRGRHQRFSPSRTPQGRRV